MFTLGTPRMTRPLSCCHGDESCVHCPHHRPPQSRPGCARSSAHSLAWAANCAPDPSPPGECSRDTKHPFQSNLAICFFMLRFNCVLDFVYSSEGHGYNSQRKLWMQCKLLWIKVSATCTNKTVYATFIVELVFHSLSLSPGHLSFAGARVRSVPDLRQGHTWQKWLLFQRLNGLFCVQMHIKQFTLMVARVSFESYGGGKCFSPSEVLPELIKAEFACSLV